MNNSEWLRISAEATAAKARRAALLAKPSTPKAQTPQYQIKREIIDAWEAARKAYIKRTTDGTKQ